MEINGKLVKWQIVSRNLKLRTCYNNNMSALLDRVSSQNRKVLLFTVSVDFHTG